MSNGLCDADWFCPLYCVVLNWLCAGDGLIN